MQLFIISFRTLFFYFFVTVCYRLMGKREVGQLGIIDLIVSILIAELVAISIENVGDSIILTVVPILLLVIVEVVFGFISTKSRIFRVIVPGRASLIICDKKIDYHQMLKQRYTLDDLLLNLRQNGIKSIEDVEYAFLESNGKLSIFKYDNKLKNKVFPLPLIMDGKIEEKYLDKVPFKKNELYNMILNKGIDIENVFYGFYKDNRIFIVERDKTKNYLNNKYITK